MPVPIDPEMAGKYAAILSILDSPAGVPSGPSPHNTGQNGPYFDYAPPDQSGPGPTGSAPQGGPDDIANALLGIGVKNTGQRDAFNNIYLPVIAGSWSGGYVDPKTLPGKSEGQNSQLWGGPLSDSAPQWLKDLVQSALGMSGDVKSARIKHILDSIMTPGSGANQHDLGYAERAFGISQ